MGIQWLYRAIWRNVLGTTARVPSPGYPNFPFDRKALLGASLKASNSNQTNNKVGPKPS